MDNIQAQLVLQLTRIADSLERAYPRVFSEDTFSDALAYAWQYRSVNGVGQGRLVPIPRPALMSFDQLKNIDRQKRLIEHNTHCFVKGLPANNVLLTGARGTGKSSLVKACLQRFHANGLRLVEIDKDHLADLPQVIELLADRPQKFIIVCDDLSFEEGDIGYKSLKTTLDGTIASQSDNVLIYATSNRRHLMASKISDNHHATRGENGALNPGEEVEEKVSLSDRFGLWISFYAFSPDEYLEAVNQWLATYDVPESRFEEAHMHAVRWATQRGSKSGRIAAQFAKSFANNSHV
ncbi:ATP-binding protein [Pseudomonas sp. Ma2-10]